MLLSTFAADGNGTAKGYAGGPGTFWAYFTSGTGTVKLQWLPAGSTVNTHWIDLPLVTLSATGCINFAVSEGSLRAVASSTGSTPSIDVGIGGFLGQGVRQG